VRLLALVAFVTVGFTAVCQGFGLAGFGTEDHPLRNFATLVPLVVGGAVLVRARRSVPVRVGAAVLGLGGAAVAWWVVPCRDDGLSLRDAVDRRDQLKARIAATPPDDIDAGIVLKLNTDSLQSQYGKLGASLRGDLGDWEYRAAEEIATRFRALSPDDAPAARALEERARKLAPHFPGAGMMMGQAIDVWTARAVYRRKNELENLPHADWAAFDKTAPGRLAVAEIGPAGYVRGTREALIRVEEEWVNESVEALIERNSEADGATSRGEVWHAIEKDVLALQSLDTGDDRFSTARRRLFDLAHASARDETNRHIKSGRYDRAFGLARKHAVEWDATAAVLGPAEVRKLDALREKCEHLAKREEGPEKPDDAIEVAPAPRPKPQE
jgi:hypothetical protein